MAGSEKGNFIGPTILSNVTADNPAYTEEIFGPVLAIVSVDTLDDAIAFINANPYGNGTAIFTASGAAARKFQRDVDVGQVRRDTSQSFNGLLGHSWATAAPRLSLSLSLTLWRIGDCVWCAGGH